MHKKRRPTTNQLGKYQTINRLNPHTRRKDRSVHVDGPIYPFFNIEGRTDAASFNAVERLLTEGVLGCVYCENMAILYVLGNKCSNLSTQKLFLLSGNLYIDPKLQVFYPTNNSTYWLRTEPATNIPCFLQLYSYEKHRTG